MPLAAAAKAAHVGEREAGDGYVRAEHLDRGDDGERIGHPMLARLRDGEGQLALEQNGADQAAAAVGGDGVDGMDVGIAAAEGDDAVGMPARRLDQTVAVRGVVGDDGNAFVLQALEDFGLGIGDRFFRPEVLDVRGRDCRNDGHVRADLAGQSGDLAGVVHAHFEDRELGIAGHPGEAERDAGVVVVALDRAVDLARAAAVERNEQGFLGAGLADRAGHSDDSAVAAVAGRAGKRLKRGERIVDEDVRAVDGLRDDRTRGAG